MFTLSGCAYDADYQCTTRRRRESGAGRRGGPALGGPVDDDGKALREGIETLRVRVAVERYQSGDVSAAEAAQIADCSIAEWLDVARERNLTTQLQLSDLELDADTVAEL